MAKVLSSCHTATLFAILFLSVMSNSARIGIVRKTYATISYFNHRMNISFHSLKKADNYALECARDRYEDEVCAGVSEKWVSVDNIIDGYTHGDGFGKHVYTVIEIPKPDDDDDDDDDDNDT